MRFLGVPIFLLLLGMLCGLTKSFTPPLAQFGAQTQICVVPSTSSRRCLGCLGTLKLQPARRKARRKSLLVATRAMSVISDGFQTSADESEWLKVSEGITTEMAEECSVEEAAGIAGVMVGLMETCSASSNRLPRSAADVLQAFWTTFLTEPDLKAAVCAPFQPALIRSIERFPELNIGVVSSCLAMSVTEEALFKEEGDEDMAQSAADSKARILELIQSMTRQPDSKRQMHGLNWMLDLIDYEALDMARSTVEMRQEDAAQKALRAQKALSPQTSPQSTSSYVEDRARELGLNASNPSSARERQDQ